MRATSRQRGGKDYRKGGERGRNKEMGEGEVGESALVIGQ